MDLPKLDSTSTFSLASLLFGGTTVVYCIWRQFESRSIASGGQSNEEEIEIYVSYSGEILKYNSTVETRLQYKNQALIGENIGVIMSPLMSMIHRSLFLKTYAQANKLKRNKINAELSRKGLGKRPLIIYDALRKPIFIEISVDSLSTSDLAKEHGLTPNGDYAFRLNGKITNTVGAEDHMNLYSQNIRDLGLKFDSDFRLTKNDIVVICIDFVDSTDILKLKGPVHMAHLNRRFFCDIADIITTYFYPFIHIHEVIGDCFVLVINADWTYSCRQFSATIAMDFINRLFHKTHEYISIRVGISQGSLYYGFIGTTLRFFGNPMHEAARLEGQGTIGSVLTNLEFYRTLMRELDGFNESYMQYLESVSKTETLHLKGYGETDCKRISLNQSSSWFLAGLGQENNSGKEIISAGDNDTNIRWCSRVSSENLVGL